MDQGPASKMRSQLSRGPVTQAMQISTLHKEATSFALCITISANSLHQRLIATVQTYTFISSIWYAHAAHAARFNAIKVFNEFVNSHVMLKQVVLASIIAVVLPYIF